MDANAGALDTFDLSSLNFLNNGRINNFKVVLTASATQYSSSAPSAVQTPASQRTVVYTCGRTWRPSPPSRRWRRAPSVRRSHAAAASGPAPWLGSPSSWGSRRILDRCLVRSQGIGVQNRGNARCYTANFYDHFVGTYQIDYTLPNDNHLWSGDKTKNTV